MCEEMRQFNIVEFYCAYCLQSHSLDNIFTHARLFILITSKMRRRYEETREKFRQSSRDVNKESSASQPKSRQNINIHIFNITSRNRNIITSTGRKPNLEPFDESMQLDEKLKRGGSVFHRKSKDDRVTGLNTSTNGPVIPTYEIKGKPSASRLNIFTKDEMASSEATPSVNIKDTAEEDVGVEELHFQKVKLQLRWKKFIKQ